jgi:hypothetical protein
MHPLNTLRRFLAIGLLLFTCGCGGADIGEACEDEGSTDDCVDDAICTNESGERAVCRQLCKEHADCPENHDCNGVSSSSLKSCQPNTP